MEPIQEIPEQPYTSANLQAIADAIPLDCDVFLSVAVPHPDMIMIDRPGYPVPLNVTLCPLSIALQSIARRYLQYLPHNAFGSRGPSLQTLRALHHTAQQLLHARHVLRAAQEGVVAVQRTGRQLQRLLRAHQDFRMALDAFR